ncbi:MAG: hypothetical protein WCO60_14385 [Verrucomicrobiota bacterium]
MNQASPKRSGSPCQARCYRALGASVFLSALVLTVLPASAGSPRVSFAYPGAAQRGTESEVTFRGTNLIDARDVLFDAPSFEITKVKSEANQFIAKIRVPADATLGEHHCRVITQSGAADLRTFFVTPFPLVEEAKTKATEKAPQLVPINTTVYGKTPVDDEDHYGVELKKGQHLSIEVVGLQLHTQNPYDPEVNVFKPDGTLLTTVGNTVFGRGAPVWTTEAPEDGVYRISIHDATHSGTGECHYLMHIGSFARPVASLPLGAPADKPTEFTLLGDSRGPIKLTASPGSLNDSTGFIYPTGDVATPSPIPVRISALTNILEGPQVASAKEAPTPAASLPGAFNGIISSAGENDFFRFSTKKGEVWDFRVFARALRSPIDSQIDIYDAKGTRIGGNDDAGNPDSYLRWTAPAEGEFILGVKDQQNRGGPLFTYRVEVDHPTPKVKISLPEMVLNSSQERRAIVIPQGNRYASLVRIKREDWVGAIQLDALNLPPDVVASAGSIEKAFDTVPMVFESSTAAPIDERLFEITGKSLEPAEAPVPTVRVDHKVDITENGNRRPFYSSFETKLPVVVTDPIPVRIDIEMPKASVVRSGQLPLKVKITRSGDFNAPMELVLLHTPPGLGTAGGVKIPAGATEGILPINATADAPLKTWKLCVVANTEIGKGPVWFSSGLFDLEVSDAPFAGTLLRTALSQNSSGQMKLKMEPKAGFEGRAKLELLGLPVGVTAKPIEIGPEDTLAAFDVQAAATATIGLNKQVVVQCTLIKDGNAVVSTCARGGILRIDKADPAPAPPAPPAAAAAPAPASPTATATAPATPKPAPPVATP